MSLKITRQEKEQIVREHIAKKTYCGPCLGGRCKGCGTDPSSWSDELLDDWVEDISIMPQILDIIKYDKLYKLD